MEIPKRGHGKKRAGVETYGSFPDHDLWAGGILGAIDFMKDRKACPTT